MSASYQSILWNRQKRLYDLALVAFIVLYATTFVTANLIIFPEVTQETLIIRTSGTLAIVLLHIILAIGPLTRLNPVFLPLLYNRRHLGVIMFFIASIHGIFSIVQFHAIGNINPIFSVFLSNMHYASLSKFPFQTLGFFGLVIFFLMAITSHDFWLHNLSPRVWKTLHMMVYMSYALIIMHVLLGVLQYETSPVLLLSLGVGLSAIIYLHIRAGVKEKREDSEFPSMVLNDFVLVCNAYEIPENRARVVAVGKERIAVFRYGDKVSAISNVCKHQNGPLGEGKIVDGCITCPWHGYQYLPSNGCSPPPFKEKVATYDVKIIDGMVWINPLPYPEGTDVQPAIIKAKSYEGTLSI